MSLDAPDFYIKQGDTQAPIAVALADATGAFDLTGSSVRFHMAPRFDTAITINGPAVVTDAAAGTVRYDWQADDTATAGDYLIEWEVTLPSGDVATFPNDGFQLVRITRQLA
jgi:hypothetical protein